MQSVFQLSFAYVLIVAAVILAMMTILFPKAGWIRTSMVICLAGVGFELSHLPTNPWALSVAALSLLPFYVAVRQSHLYKPLLVVTILMLTVGSFYLFINPEGHPLLNVRLAGGVSVISGEFIWLALEREQLIARRAKGLDTKVGLVGLANTDVYTDGVVEVDGEMWPARSENPIPAGSHVRILEFNGFLLKVKKVEKISRD